jgi:hypothetical protein
VVAVTGGASMTMLDDKKATVVPIFADAIPAPPGALAL